MANTATIYYNGVTIASNVIVDDTVEISYGNTTIATVGPGTWAIKCANLPAASDIVIGNKKLKCNNLPMVADIIVAIESLSPQLDTPINLEADGFTVSFDEVENATRYRVLANGVSIGVFDTATLITDSNGNLLTDSAGNYLEFMEA